MSREPKKKVRVVVEGEATVIAPNSDRVVGRAAVYRSGLVVIRLDAFPVDGQLTIILPGEFT